MPNIGMSFYYDKKKYYFDGVLFKQLLKQRGLTQKKLSRIMNLPIQMISDWHIKQTMPRKEIMIRVCRLLQISVDDLIVEKNENKEQKLIREQKALKKIDNNRSIDAKSPIEETLSILNHLSHYEDIIQNNRSEYDAEVTESVLYYSLLLRRAIENYIVK